MLTDSHCHLDFPEFAPEIDAVVARARAAGVGRIITISTRVARHEAIAAIAERYDDVFFTVGHASRIRPPRNPMSRPNGSSPCRDTPNASASAKRGSITITTRCRARSRRRSSAPISRRRGRRGCRW